MNGRELPHKRILRRREGFDEVVRAVAWLFRAARGLGQGHGVSPESESGGRAGLCRSQRGDLARGTTIA